MDRITDHLPGGGIYVKSETGTEGTGAATTQRRLPEIIRQLCAYEDTGYSPEDFDKLCREMSDLRMALGLNTYDDLRKIIQDDRLLVLPCAIGTPVFVHEQLCSRGKQLTYDGCKYSQDCMRDRSIKCPLRVVKRAFTVNMRKGLGITFWLTKKEAEDAIPQDRRDGNHGND